jgi:DNA processing protein
MHPTTIERLTENQIPEQLRELPKPPKELYLRGTNPFVDTTRKFVTIVGSRNHSRYAVDAIKHIISGLAGHPVVIVSGIALGIDAMAHEEALNNGLLTVAFPGSGLAPSALHPSSNRGLADRILDTGGALVSEFLPDQRGAIWTFPVRNRLVAGLADMTLIIEAGHDSGTLITANLALEYNRTVGAVPGSIFSPTSAGCNALLRKGAVPITSGHDVLRELGMADFVPFVPDSKKLRDATELELKILELLREPRTRNDISRILSIPVSELSSTIGIMELKSYVIEEFGEIRRIV